MKLTAQVSNYMSSIGASGGHSRSAAKVAAAIANGKLGGKPRDVSRLESLGFTQANTGQVLLTIHSISKKKGAKRQ